MPTIAGGVKRSEEAGGANTVEVAEGDYEQPVSLNKAADRGLTINGEEPGVQITGKAGSTVSVALSGAVTLSNLSVVNQAGSGAAILDSGAELTLQNVSAENESTSGVDGIQVTNHGSLKMSGGSASMENGASGFAVEGHEAALMLAGVTILNGAASQAEAGGINSEKSTLAVTNTKVAIESGLGTVHFGVATGSDTSVSLSEVSVRQNTPAAGVVLEKSPASVAGLRVEMLDSTSATPGVIDESETPGISASLAHVEVSGTWKGTGVLIDGEQATLSDSRVLMNSPSAAPALRYAGGESGTGLVVQRTVLQAPPAAKPAVAAIADSNATFDSSEVLGGTAGITSEASQGGTHTLTVAASTIGPNPGISFETPGVVGVEATTSGNKSSSVQATIEGSIVLESQVAKTANSGNSAQVTCAYSAIPSQIQSVNAIHGEVACASGASGNTDESTEFATLFAEPLHNYSLSPSSSAIDSVPAGAIALPFGLTPSATDLAGTPRVLDGRGSCKAIQDKGALELQGHEAACVAAACACAAPGQRPLTPKGTTAVAALITGLRISPSAFFAAPKGATLAKASKQRYGAKISWRDSEAASTTLTLLRPIGGRRQGRSCKRPSKRNRHGRRCTLLVALASFVHADRAGANSVHFSGRLKGRKLARGSYVLQAVPRNAAGTGARASLSFKIE